MSRKQRRSPPWPARATRRPRRSQITAVHLSWRTIFPTPIWSTTDDGDVMVNTGFMDDANQERNVRLLKPHRTGPLRPHHPDAKPCRPFRRGAGVQGSEHQGHRRPRLQPGERRHAAACKPFSGRAARSCGAARCAARPAPKPAPDVRPDILVDRTYTIRTGRPHVRADQCAGRRDGR